MRRAILLGAVLVLAWGVGVAAQVEFGAGIKLAADTPFLIAQVRWGALAVEPGFGFSFLRVAEGRKSALWYSGHLKYYPWRDLVVTPYIGAGAMGFAMHLSYLGEELGRATGQAGELIVGGEFSVQVGGAPLQTFGGIGWTFTSVMTFDFLEEAFVGRHVAEGLGSYHLGLRVDF